MSCTVGRFDDHRRDGMAELMVRAPDAGAVAALAATGEVFGSESSALNDRFVDEFFPISPRADSLRTVGLAWARQRLRADVQGHRRVVVETNVARRQVGQGRIDAFLPGTPLPRPARGTVSTDDSLLDAALARRMFPSPARLISRQR